MIEDPCKFENKRKSIAPINKLFTTGADLNKKNIILKTIMIQYLDTGKLINYIEIGVKFASTLKFILENTKKENIPIFVSGLDLFEDFELSRDNTHFGDVANMNDIKTELNRLGHFNFQLYKGDSSKIIKEKLEKLNNCVVFIDGNHTYEGVKKDYEEIIKKISKGSLLIFDDYEWKGVNEFVKTIKTKHKIIEETRDYIILQY
jgi:hypothetical protein